MTRGLIVCGAVVVISTVLLAQSSATPDWARLESETMQHFQALVRDGYERPPGK